VRKWLTACLVLSGTALFLANSLHLLKKAGTAAVVTYGNADLYEYFFPYLTFARTSILNGTIPWWTPYQAVGSPFLAAIQIGLLYPLNWTILLFDVPTALLITQLLNVAVGLVGMAVYLRYLELHWSAVTLGAALFGYSVFVGSYHFSNTATFCWAPLIFWRTHRLIEKPSFAACVSLTGVMAVSFLGGNIQYFYYMSVLLATYAFFLVLCSGNTHEIQKMSLKYGLFILAFLLMIGLVSVQLFPTLEFAQHSIRNLSRQFSGGDPFGQEFSPLDFVQSFLGGTKSGNYFGASLLLIGFAFGSRKRKRIAILFCAMLLYTMLFVLSKEKPLFAVFGALPFSDSFRYPTRMLVMDIFIVPALAAIGLSSFWDRVPLRIRNPSSRTPNVFWSLIIIFSLVLFYMTYQTAERDSIGLPFYPLVFLCCLLLFFFLLSFAAGVSEKTREVFSWVVALLLALDVFIHVDTVLPVPAFAAANNTGIFAEQFEWVKKQAVHDRVLLIPDGFGCYNPNVGTMFGFHNINSYETFTLTRWKNYVQHMMDAIELEEENATFNGILRRAHVETIVRKADMIGLTSLRYLVLPESRPGEIVRELIDNSQSAWKLVREGDDATSKIFVYENELALPRVYLVNSYEITHTESESLSRIEKNASNLSSSVVLENGAPSFPSAVPSITTGQISIESYDINEVRLRARADNPSLAILTDCYYPGWSAFVDGVRKPLWRANSLFRAVEIPPGTHTIVFRYSPSNLRWGMTISLLTLAFIIVGVYVERRYTRRVK